MAVIRYDGPGGQAIGTTPFDQATAIASKLGKTVDQLLTTDLISGGVDPVSASQLVSDIAQVATGGNTAGVTTGTPTTGTGAQQLAKQVGINLYTKPTTGNVSTPGTGTTAITPAGTTTGTPGGDTTTKVATSIGIPQQRQSTAQLPGLVPFKFNPSRTLDPNAARQQAGQKAFMQLQPQFLAKEQQKRLALQGLDMLRQRLQQGVEQASASTLRNVPKFVDQARVLRASQGLSESGFLNADQTNIQSEALNTIAQNAEQARLQEAQAAEQVNLANQGTDAEIAALQGQVSLGPNGEYTGSLVDTMTQDLLDRNAQFTMEERKLALDENRVANEMNLARYNAQVARDQGDERLAQQWESQAQSHQDNLAQIGVQKDQLAETKRANQSREQAGSLAQQVDVIQKFGPAGGVWAFDGLTKFNAGDLKGAQESFTNAQAAIDQMSAGKEAATVSLKVLESQISSAAKYKLPSTQKAVLDYYMAAYKGDPNAAALGAQAEAAARADGDMEFDAKKDYAIWERDNITNPAAAFRASLTNIDSKDYDKALGPVANSYIRKAQEAEKAGNTPLANENYTFAAEAASEWKDASAKPSENPSAVANANWKAIMSELDPLWNPSSPAALIVPFAQRKASAKAVVTRWLPQLSDDDATNLTNYLKSKGLY